jgi:hypothetical protein
LTLYKGLFERYSVAVFRKERIKIARVHSRRSSNASAS